MKHDNTAIEQRLRSLPWRAPADGVLEEILQTTLAERRKIPQRRLLGFIPRSLRLPLAACWTASLLFWWCTPRETPSSTLATSKIESADDPARFMAERETERRLTHELLLALEDHGPRH